MNFATWSLRNPIPSILLFLLLSLAGLHGFERLSIQNLPDLDLPTINVQLTQPGAAPSQLESEVARKVEDSLASISGLKHIRTAISDGQVQLRVEFVLEKQLSDALIETKDAVDRIRSDLPDDMLQPSVTAVTMARQPILTYAVVAHNMSEEALSWLVDNTVTKALLEQQGVSRVERIGGVQREVRVEVDPVQLIANGLTAADVSRTLRLTQQDASGGRSELGMSEQGIRTLGNVRQAQDLAALPISQDNGRALRLDQVAQVTDGTAERTQFAELDGLPVVGFNLYRAKGSDETRIAEAVDKTLKALQAEQSGLKFSVVSSTVDYTREQYRGSMQMLYEGALLAILVVWWFLRDWRATLLAAVTLPLSILPAFAAMWWLGYSLNTLTLLALAVVVGILVDDAIVEIENIERHRGLGKPLLEATGDAVNEIALAVIATTLTLVVVFVPTALMSGIPGLFFQQFGWTTVIAVLSSLLVARLLTPILAVKFLHNHVPKPRPDSRWMTLYLRLARIALNHRLLTFVAALVFFAASLALVPLIPKGLIPPSDRGYTVVNFELPPGSTLEDTLAVGQNVRVALWLIPSIEHVFSTAGVPEAGQNGQGIAQVRKGSLTLTLGPRDERDSQAKIEHKVRQVLAYIPGARFSVGAGSPGEKITLILTGEDSQALKLSAQALVRELRGVGSLSNISSNASLEQPEISIRPDYSKAAERGVSSAAIAQTIRIATVGDFDAQLPKLTLDNRQVAIRVRMGDTQRNDLEALNNLRVSTVNGLVPLSSVASLTVGSGPVQIDRYDRRRYVEISADLSGMPMGQAVAEALALPAARALPAGIKIIQSGDGEAAAELASSFGTAMIAGLLCVFCVLILLFKDFLQPLTILCAIPLSLGGAFIALVLSGSELDVPSMIGLIMLMGIVVKNSILLVEYAVVGMRERQLAVHEAILEACHKRARPIVMTSLAMIAGMLPIALGLGADASFRQPMAIAVIGGLVTSTALSLLVVPVVFSYVDDAERWLHRLSRLVGQKAHAAVSRP
ncbi:RND transporter [Pseudomonas fluorescens]|uniref:RND transporter n=1 Tax=Pseudomonas fluorescens TaxID=294 RepID=A0A1T2Z8G4_PSEFL|nr:efflux RND transporter permease subunit [Pseudomonas fluorescens]OPB00933.1 RND transporter [Pseudomonas fluorescens]